jgi:hypothetical protein
LNQLAQGQSVIAEPAGDCDNKSRVAQDQLMQRGFIVAFAPAPRQFELVIAREQRRLHRGADEG